MGVYVIADVYANFDETVKAYNYVMTYKEEFEECITNYQIKLFGPILKIEGDAVKSISGFLQTATKFFDGYIAASYEEDTQPGMRYMRIYTKGQLVGDYEADLDDDKVDEFRKAMI